jgi:hypothetical protein
MKKANKDFTLYVKYIVSILTVLIFMQTCGTKRNIKDLNDELVITQNKIDSLINVTATKNEIDSLRSIIITKNQMIELIEETPAWNTLRIEEISDKEKISINALEQKELK